MASSDNRRWIWFVTGPTACGKTTMAKFMAKELDMTYIEGDDFHPKANIEKMSKGIPLDDSDRWNWLQKLRDDVVEHAGREDQNCVATCSALKRKYRDILRDTSYYAANLQVRFLFLDAPEPVLQHRAEDRQEHFAKANIVNTQFETLEPPVPEETDVFSVDVSPPQEEVEHEVLEKVRDAMKSE